MGTIQVTYEEFRPGSWRAIIWSGDERRLELLYDGKREGVEQMVQLWLRLKGEDYGAEPIQV